LTLIKTLKRVKNLCRFGNLRFSRKRKRQKKFQNNYMCPMILSKKSLLLFALFRMPCQVQANHSVLKQFNKRYLKLRAGHMILFQVMESEVTS
jgi:hypothetical protein